MSSLGDKILTEITKQGMVTLVEPKYEGTLVFAWAANFADQIEAVIAKHQHDPALERLKQAAMDFGEAYKGDMPQDEILAAAMAYAASRKEPKK